MSMILEPNFMILAAQLRPETDADLIQWYGLQSIPVVKLR